MLNRNGKTILVRAYKYTATTVNLNLMILNDV